jgi:hypothetical protein
MAHGQAAADALLPEVAEHLEAGCGSCDADLDELVALLDETDGDVFPDGDAPLPGPTRPVPPDPWAAPASHGELAGSARGPAPSDDAGSGADDGGRGGDDPAWDKLLAARQPRPGQPRPATPQPVAHEDSGVFAADLPDARAIEAEAVRRQRLRRVRDLLLIAAAVSVLLLGLSLVGLAYLARQASEPVQVPLVPLVPSGSVPGQRNAPPGQPAAAPAQPSSSGARAVPDGMNCPSTHPVKGNRESGIYHVPSGTSYAATRPEVCYASPADAEADGYRRSMR